MPISAINEIFSGILGRNTIDPVTPSPLGIVLRDGMAPSLCQAAGSGAQDGKVTQFADDGHMSIFLLADL